MNNKLTVLFMLLLLAGCSTIETKYDCVEEHRTYLLCSTTAMGDCELIVNDVLVCKEE